VFIRVEVGWLCCDGGLLAAGYCRGGLLTGG